MVVLSGSNDSNVQGYIFLVSVIETAITKETYVSSH